MSVCPYCAGTGQTLAADVTVTVSQATKVAGVSLRTIYNWISAGKVEAVTTPGGSIRIRLVSLRVREKDGAA